MYAELEFDEHLPVFRHFSGQIREKNLRERFVRRVKFLIKLYFYVQLFSQNVIMLEEGSDYLWLTGRRLESKLNPAGDGPSGIGGGI